MKKNYWIILSIGLAFALGVYIIPGTAQQQAAQQPLPTLVAVVDLFQVLRAHPEFKTQMEEFQTQVRARQAQFQTAREGVQREERALQESGLRPGTSEHQQALEQLHRKAAEIEASFRAEFHRFALRESEIMYNTHQNIRETIGRFAQAQNIAQVTDIHQLEVDPTVPETVVADMEQSVVWFNPNLNITNHIIRQIYADRGRQIPDDIQTAISAGRPIR